MTLLLPALCQHQMITQAEQTYPEECCGLLLGIREASCDRSQVYEILPLENQWTEAIDTLIETVPPPTTQVSRRNRYWVDPKDLMAAQRDSRDRGWLILGVYHSHPDHEAVPSERDRRLAWSGYAYPILSVVAGRVVALHSWRLNDQTGLFAEEAIAILPCEAL